MDGLDNIRFYYEEVMFSFITLGYYAPKSLTDSIKKVSGYSEDNNVKHDYPYVYGTQMVYPKLGI